VNGNFNAESIVMPGKLYGDCTPCKKMRAQFGQTSLSWSSSNGHLPVVKVLLAWGANIEIKDEVRHMFEHAR
jgi:hypothetical protein